jgi:hypothetical protein
LTESRNPSSFGVFDLTSASLRILETMSQAHRQAQLRNVEELQSTTIAWGDLDSGVSEAVREETPSLESAIT